ETYKMTMTVRGSDEGSLVAKLGDFNSGPAKTIAFTKEWQDVEVEYKSTVANSFLLVQSGHFVGDIHIRNIQFAQPVQGKKMTDDTKAIIVKAAAKKADPWDNQFWLKLGNFAQGAKYEFTARVRADHSAKASTQIHNAPGSYVDWNAIGDIQFTSEWTDVKVSGTFAAAGQSIAFNLSEDTNANTYYFANMSFKVGGTERLTNGNLEGTDMSAFVQKVDQGAVVTCETQSGFQYVQLPQPIPLSAQERHDTLVYAMDKWIKGMMTACKGKVKAWDLVNESISGGGADAEGVYALQHDNGSGDFFWQDYMGDLEYVRQAHRLARLYGPEDVKLFINDYNLESDWDNNGKLKSLIKWIERWEADGVTHIDGIGTQMHISCYANTTTQNSKKKGIENMLKLMAATGKYVRVSELDMGMVDASGNDVPTSKMTETYHKKMADLYKWIVQKYLEIVPVEQQWGICQWCAT
ncbi:MAG: endo-1,4-beta-xylanase, partial [Bacteroidaceae bacterium]|nr:endo-1,4-beta-xylanase [Bacteroidaceae bacterium]